MLITLNSQEVATARDVSFKWDTKNWTGSQYNAGLLNSSNDPRRTERIGIYGQLAFGKALNRPVDLTKKKGGDKCDDAFCGQTIDIKNASRDAGKGYVTAAKHRRKAMGLKDIYVFSYLRSESDDCAEVMFVGVKSAVNFSLTWLYPSPVATHLNWEVPYEELHPFDKFIECYNKTAESRKHRYEIIR